MARELAVFLGERRAGTLTCVVRASSFEYDADYLADPRATPLSLSMPLRPGVIPPSVVDPFLWGLLPDNADTLQRWAVLARPQADEHNPFSLLQHYGRDCAGAVQFLAPDEVDQLTVPGPTQWLGKTGVAAQLRALHADPTAWTFENTAGRFSLGGAQAKFALLKSGSRWGRPSGATPTTHIVKPGIPEYRANALNEHVCVSLASHLGLPAARTSIESFEGEPAIVGERYDRVSTASGIERLHQEDLCQALSVRPSQKYQDDGGPSVARVAGLFRRVLRKDMADATISRYLLAVGFNWLIAAPDAHAKNYSVLLRESAIAPAPLYDIATLTPYARYNPATAHIAQAVDGRYRIAQIGGTEWVAQAKAVGIDGDRFLVALRQLAEQAPPVIEQLCSAPDVRAIDAEFATILRDALLTRVDEAARMLR